VSVALGLILRPKLSELFFSGAQIGFELLQASILHLELSFQLSFCFGLVVPRALEFVVAGLELDQFRLSLLDLPLCVLVFAGKSFDSLFGGFQLVLQVNGLGGEGLPLLLKI